LRSRGRAAEGWEAGLVDRRVSSHQLRYSASERCQAPAAAYNNAPPAPDISILLAAAAGRTSANHPSLAAAAAPPPPSSLATQRETLLRDVIFEHRALQLQAYNKAYRDMQRSRSKSLSRRRSFSITAECNYKGARNCSPGGPRSVHRGNRETQPPRRGRPPVKYRPGERILKLRV
jgi:hypothetical protein